MQAPLHEDVPLSPHHASLLAPTRMLEVLCRECHIFSSYGMIHFACGAWACA